MHAWYVGMYVRRLLPQRVPGRTRGSIARGARGAWPPPPAPRPQLPAHSRVSRPHTQLRLLQQPPPASSRAHYYYRSSSSSFSCPLRPPPVGDARGPSQPPLLRGGRGRAGPCWAAAAASQHGGPQGWAGGPPTRKCRGSAGRPPAALAPSQPRRHAVAQAGAACTFPPPPPPAQRSEGERQGPHPHIAAGGERRRAGRRKPRPRWPAPRPRGPQRGQV
jgi:hypothetical protein